MLAMRGIVTRNPKEVEVHRETARGFRGRSVHAGLRGKRAAVVARSDMRNDTQRQKSGFTNAQFSRVSPQKPTAMPLRTPKARAKQSDFSIF